MSAIAFHNVVKRYGAVEALRGVSLTVEHGEMFGLIGPDGAGKTTAIRALCGLLHINAGSIRVLNHDPIRQHRQVTGTVGYLSQRFSLYGDLSIDENIAFFAEIHGVRDYHARRDRLLEMTQLTRFRDRLADQLSGGMKQKLALACTLVHEPKVIVLDEPTTGVDPVSRREFWKVLSQFLSQGITIVISTPYLDEAERCARIALLHEGRVLALDQPSRLRTSLAGTLFEVLVQTPRDALDRLANRPDIASAQIFGDRLHVWINRPDAEAARAVLASATSAAGIQVGGTRAIVPSLEDVFIARLATDGAASDPTATASTESAGS
ncbi:MAG: ABC transporter ATP-binding protein [Alphaproteobacteria bacterium]|nr:ABC transporter ATP-binding protein [Alphaproteobacteria bacterium]